MPLRAIYFYLLFFLAEFKLDDKLKQCIDNAKKEYEAWCDSLSIDYILYEGLNKGDCKKYKVSPDCIMQLSFQVRNLLIIQIGY